jgi:hypothetical protein
MTESRGWAPPETPSPAAQPPRSAPIPPEGPPRAPQAGAPGGWTPPPKPGLIPLRPLTLGTILAASARVIRHNPRPVLGAGLLLFGSVSIGLALVVTEITNRVTSRISMAVDGQRDDIVAGSLLAGGLALLAATAVSLIVYVLIQGVVSIDVARAALGEKPSTRQLFRRSRGRLGALVGWSLSLVGTAVLAIIVVGVAVWMLIAFGGPAGIIIAVLLGLGSALLLFGASAWLWTKLSLVPSALMIERMRLSDAVRRSWTLTRGAFWRTLGIEWLVQLIVGIAAQVVSFPFALLSVFLIGILAPQGDETTTATITVIVQVVGYALSAITGAIAVIMQSATGTLLYLDLRMRREGLDIELQRVVEERAAGREPERDPFATPTAAAPRP